MYSPISEPQLIEQHAALVRRLALQLISRLPANVEFDDLLQAGMMGLLDAVRRYTPSENAQFETYATTRIRGAMLDELRSQDWLPRSVRRTSRKIEAAIQELQQQLLRPPTEAEIAARLEISIEAYHTLLESAHGMQIVHFDDFSRHSEGSIGDSGIPPLQSAQLSDTEDPVRLLMAQGLREVLVSAIGSLPERERLLLSLQFEQDLNQKEIAVVLGVSEGRVSQLRTQAVARIRAFLAAGSWDTSPQDRTCQNLL